jgi:hypothetical protein
MNEDMIFIPTEPVICGSCILSRKIAAIRLDYRAGQNSEKAKLGSILQLPAGSNLEVCGGGFNSRTVKVRHQNSYYFVFEEDLAR